MARAKSKRKQHHWRPVAPDGPVDTPSLAAFRQLAIDIEEGLRALQWQQVDQILELMYELKKMGFGHYAAADIVGEAAGYKGQWAMILERIAVTFPEPSRVPGFGVIMYRVALRSRDPWSAIEYAAKNNLTTEQFNAWIDETEPDRKRYKYAQKKAAGAMQQTEGD